MPDSGVDHVLEFLHWLSTRGCGHIGKTVFGDAMPDVTTAASVFAISVGSPPPMLTMSTGSYIRQPRFRVDTRSTAPGPLNGGDYPDITNARNLAQKAYQACLSLVDLKIISTGASPSTGHWLSANPEQEPFLNGRDNQNRVIFSFYVGCMRQGR